MVLNANDLSAMFYCGSDVLIILFLLQVCNLAWCKNVNELVSTHGYSQNQIMVWKYPSMSKVSLHTVDLNISKPNCRMNASSGCASSMTSIVCNLVFLSLLLINNISMLSAEALNQEMLKQQ